MLSNEENGEIIFPKTISGLRSDQEIVVCMQKCWELKRGLKKAIDSKHEGLMIFTPKMVWMWFLRISTKSF